MLLLITLAAFAAWFFWERSHRETHSVSGGLHPEINLPHEQEFELYHNAFSLCAKKTRVCLAELDIPYKGHHIDLIETGSYQTISREFLAVNPAATVPVLVHNGHPVYESHEQIRYAAKHAPAGQASLIPDDPAAAAQMQEWVDRSSLSGPDPLANAAQSAASAVPGLTVPVFAGMIRYISFWRICEGLLFHLHKERPVMFLVMKVFGLERLHKLKPAVRILASSARHMNDHLGALEAQLEVSGGPWILGKQFTLGDVSWLVIFERLSESDHSQYLLAGDSRARCRAYWDRLQDRPAFQAAIVDHRHPLVTLATTHIRAAKAANPELRAALEPPL